MPMSHTDALLEEIENDPFSGTSAYPVIVVELMQLGHTYAEAREIAHDALRS